MRDADLRLTMAEFMLTRHEELMECERAWIKSVVALGDAEGIDDEIEEPVGGIWR